MAKRTATLRTDPTQPLITEFFQVAGQPVVAQPAGEVAKRGAEMEPGRPGRARPAAAGVAKDVASSAGSGSGDDYSSSDGGAALVEVDCPHLAAVQASIDEVNESGMDECSAALRVEGGSTTSIAVSGAPLDLLRLEAHLGAAQPPLAYVDRAPVSHADPEFQERYGESVPEASARLRAAREARLAQAAAAAAVSAQTLPGAASSASGRTRRGHRARK